MADTPVQALEKQYGAVKKQQDLWLPDWRDLSDMYKPTVSNWLYGDGSSRKGRRNKKIIDGAGLYSRRALQAGMMSGLSSPSRPWFKCVIADPEMMRFAPVSRWLYAVQKCVLDIFSRSNFYDVLQQQYGDWGVFGNMGFDIDEATGERYGKVIHCVPLTIGSYYTASDEDSLIDTTFRRSMMTVRQMVGKFGLEKCSNEVRTQFERGNIYQPFEVLRAVLPNSDRDYDSADNANMPIRSCWWQPGEKQFLKESGYEEKASIVARWELDSPDDDIGVGPGLMGLGACRALQLQQKRKASAIDKHLDPPLIGDPGVKNEVATHFPGEINWHGFLPNGQAPKLQPLYQTQPRIEGLMEDIAELKQEINKAMFTDVFLMLSNDARAQPPTAEEIRARETERMLMLGPVVERGGTEIFQPAFDRVFAIIVRRSMPYWTGVLNGDPLIPPPPQELAGTPLKVELISILAQAQKAASLSGIERLLGFVGQISQGQAAIGQQPDAADNIDFDQAIEEYGTALGVAPTIVRGDDEVAQLRQARAEQQAQAQQAAQAEQQAAAAAQGATAAQKLSQTPTGGDSALAQLLGTAA